MATLYIVGTPIGNLEDITLRALRVLKEAELILCEDTRVTKRLLSKYNISTSTLSHHAQSKLSKVEKILALIPKKTSYPVCIVGGMKDAIDRAREIEKKGDIVLLSPGDASFGVFKNEFDRGDQFIKRAKEL